MYGLFAGITTLDVAQLTAGTVHENQKVTSLDQMLAAGGPATNAAVVFSHLSRLTERDTTPHGGPNPGGAMAPVLVTAIGQGPAAHLILEDLEAQNVALVDCTDYEAEVPEQTGKLDFTPSLSAILINAQNNARTVASTNTRLPLKPEYASETLEAMGKPQVVLVDGHNPDLAMTILKHGVPDSEDPFDALEHKPDYLRILDGGSWKPWLPPMLGYIDVAVISADFMPPGAVTFEDTVAFLRGFGIERVIRTAGADPVQWYWLGKSGRVAPPAVTAIDTLAAGDNFHGAFAWGCAHGIVNRDTEDPTPLIDFSNRVASMSTTSFGTRAWLGDIESLSAEIERLL
ncbi:MAG: PfkB family carbohydrate kinase [Actinomycetaceae bacterium]|nr:PfkB family carbohydrate kinase [Actinomycetaceae bacterium]